MSSPFENNWFGHNRTLCDVLSDMRKLDKTKNYAALCGLIEEAQMMGNRMEAALADQKDLQNLSKKQSAGRKSFKKLEEEFKELSEKVSELKPEPKD